MPGLTMETSDRESILLEIAEVGQQLASLKQQQDETKARLQSLRERLVKFDEQTSIRLSISSDHPIVTTLTPEEKVDLFLNLFQGRNDVYPKLWQNQKTGKNG